MNICAERNKSEERELQMAGCKESVEIDAPVERVYELLVDFDRYSEFMPGVRETIVLDREDDMAIVEFSIKVIKEFNYTLRFTFAPPEELSWTYVGGDFKNITGGWTLERVGGGKSRATYTVDIDGGFFIPKAISNQLLKFNVPELLQAVKARCEG